MGPVPPGGPVPGPATPGYPGAPVAPAPRQSRTVLWVFIAVAVVLVVALAVLLVVPVSHPFHDELTSSSSTPADELLTFPSGAAVSGSWSVIGGGSVNFEILGAGGPIDSATGSSGTFAFTATIGIYFFEVNSTTPETVDLSGSYSAPIL